MADPQPAAPAVRPAAVAPTSAPRVSLADRIEALHASYFPGSRLGFDTELWNLVRKFTDEVKSLVAASDSAV